MKMNKYTFPIRILLILILPAAFIFNSPALAASTSTEMTFSEDWKVDFNGDDSRPFYTVKSKDDDTIGLRIFKSTASAAKADNISIELKKYSKAIIDNVNAYVKSTSSTINTETKKLTGTDFSGEYILLGFNFEKVNSQDSLFMSVFALSDGENIWLGDYCSDQLICPNFCFGIS